MDLITFVGYPLLVIAVITLLIFRKIMNGNDLKEKEKKSILIAPLVFKKKRNISFGGFFQGVKSKRSNTNNTRN